MYITDLGFADTARLINDNVICSCFGLFMVLKIFISVLNILFIHFNTKTK